MVLPSVNAAESFNEAIKNATTSGQFRLGYIAVDPDVAGANTTNAMAFGGIIKFETEKWKRMQFAIAPYFSERIKTYSGKNAQKTPYFYIKCNLLMPLEKEGHFLLLNCIALSGGFKILLDIVKIIFKIFN